MISIPGPGMDIRYSSCYKKLVTKAQDSELRFSEEWEGGQIKNTSLVSGVFLISTNILFQFFTNFPLLFKHCLFTLIFGHQEGENKKTDGGETFSKEKFEELQEKVFMNIEKERNNYINLEIKTHSNWFSLIFQKAHYFEGIKELKFFHLYFYLIWLKVKELNQYLEAERSSRTDLEMYVAVLNTQKGQWLLSSFCTISVAFLLSVHEWYNIGIVIQYILFYFSLFSQRYQHYSYCHFKFCA